MEEIGPSSDEFNDDKPEDLTLGERELHSPPPPTGSKRGPSLSTLQSVALSTSIIFLTFIFTSVIYLFSAFIWGFGGLVAVADFTGTTGTEIPGYWESMWAGVILCIALWGAVTMWRGIRQKLDGVISALMKPPMWLFAVSSVGMLLLLRFLFEDGQDLPLFLRGTVEGFWLFTAAVALPYTIYWCSKGAKRFHTWAANNSYRAGLVTATSFAVVAFLGLMAVGTIAEIADEIDDSMQTTTTADSPAEARFMGIMSGDGATEEDEIIARRRDECFNKLGDTSTEIFEQGHWKALRRLRTEERAQDAVFRAILKVCKAHGEEEKDNIESYFHGVLKNHLVDLEERRVREASLCRIELEDTFGISPPSQGQRTRDRQELAAIQQAFCKLSYNQREALKAFSLGHPHSEIAKKLNTTEANSRTLVRRARQKVLAETYN